MTLEDLVAIYEARYAGLEGVDVENEWFVGRAVVPASFEVVDYSSPALREQRIRREAWEGR